jgi:hypothetical protein
MQIIFKLTQNENKIEKREPISILESEALAIKFCKLMNFFEMINKTKIEYAHQTVELEDVKIEEFLEKRSKILENIEALNKALGEFDKKEKENLEKIIDKSEEK